VALRDLVTRSSKKIRKDGGYHFFIWINPEDNTATEFEEWNNTLELTPYLDNFEAFATGGE
jgi:hypothetical protein